MLLLLEYDIYDSIASIVHDVPYNYPEQMGPCLQLDRSYFGNIIQYVAH